MNEFKSISNLNQLKPGDLIRHKKDIKYVYIVTDVKDNKVSAVRNVDITNASEWEKLYEKMPDKDVLDEVFDNMVFPNKDKLNDLDYQLNNGPYHNYYHSGKTPMIYFHVWIKFESGNTLKFAKYKFIKDAYFFDGIDDL